MTHSPAAKIDALTGRFSELSPMSATIKAAIVVVIPALPKRISIRIIFLRTGWLTIDSDSDVVNPTPENAD